MPNPSLPDLLRRQFPTAAFAEDDPNLALGSFSEWDSLAHFHLLMSIEEAYSVRFSITEISEIKSLAAIRNALAGKTSYDCPA
jgi:acyl carrier protein